MTKYYRISKNPLKSPLHPSGFFERADEFGLDYWCPLVNSPPIFKISEVKESCFSTTIEGALFGLFSNDGKPGKYNVYETKEKPDIDLTDETIQDFGVIEEVRYRKPVEIKKTCDLTIPSNIIDNIQKCQVETEDAVFFNEECGIKVKKEIRDFIKKTSTCYD